MSDFAPFDSPRVLIFKASARVKSSSDGATGTWSSVTSPGTNLRSMCIEPDVSQNLIAAIALRLRISTDWGATWADLGAAFPNATTESGVVVLPGGQIIIVAYPFSGTNMRVLRSTDRGATWAVVTVGPLQWGSWRQHNFYYNKYVAGTVFAVEQNGGPIWKSTDSGATWAASKAATANQTYDGLFFTQAETILFFQHQQNGQPNSAKIFRSIDNGVTWTEVFTTAVAGYGDTNNHHHSVFTQADGGRIFFYEAVWQSDDDGLTWQAGPRTGPSNAGGGMGRCDAALFCSTDDVSVILRSTDGGTTWTAMNPIGDPVGRIDLLLTDDLGATPINPIGETGVGSEFSSLLADIIGTLDTGVGSEVLAMIGLNLFDLGAGVEQVTDRALELFELVATDVTISVDEIIVIGTFDPRGDFEPSIWIPVGKLRT